MIDSYILAGAGAVLVVATLILIIRRYRSQRDRRGSYLIASFAIGLGMIAVVLIRGHAFEWLGLRTSFQQVVASGLAYGAVVASVYGLARLLGRARS